MTATVLREPAEAPLPLPSFRVDGYRGIPHLFLPKLERVNLFVGTNNSGKTALLEAIRLFATSTPRGDLIEILRERSGYNPGYLVDTRAGIASEEAGFALNAARSLFYGSGSAPLPPVYIGVDQVQNEHVALSLPWSDLDEGQGSGDLLVNPSTGLITVSRGNRSTTITVGDFLRRTVARLRTASTRVEFVPAGGISARRVVSLWEHAAESGRVVDVEQALRTVVPDLERVYLIGQQSTQRIVLQVRGAERAVPLANMGDGANRIFGIALALVRAAGGVLLVDEIENGLHYSVQIGLWKALFSLADTLDVQVFATTHSWDSVVGFQAGAAASPARGMLYRLDRRIPGKVHAVRYTDDEIAIAADQQIEVR